MRMPTPPPPWQKLLRELGPEVIRLVPRGLQDPGYPSWDELRRKRAPEGMTAEEWWVAIKLARFSQYRELPLQDTSGKPFVFALPDAVLSGLDEISRRAGGHLNAPDLVVNPATRDRYLINSLMEESITSSQLEGASTSRRVAREMLRTSRRPRNRDELMIVNNYRAMQFVRDNLDEPITPETVLELHRIVTEGTLDNPTDAGRLQTPGEERVAVWSEPDDLAIHQPPPAEQLPERLAALCRFAQGEAGGPWMHPALRAIITHFMVGYDHYFADGNGRTARALFYWVALKNRLWLLEFVAISRILRDAPAQYARAYVHSEQDDGDVTYFVFHQLKVINRAIDDLHNYLDRKSREMVEARELVQGLALNHRQLAVVEGALRDPGIRVTVRSHAASHGVTALTARTDLRGLEDLDILTSHKEGRAQVWRPQPDLVQVLHRRRS